MTVFNLYILYCPVAVKSKEGSLMIRSNVHEHDTRQGQDLVVPNIGGLKVVTLSLFQVSGFIM